MTQNECLNLYTSQFGYKELLFQAVKDKKSFIKKTKEGFIIIESLNDSNVVNFYFNDKIKKFKKSHLVCCAIENLPAAWEEESE